MSSPLPTPPIRLLHDHVLVVPDKDAEKTKSGLIIPRTAKQHEDRELLSGRVALIGPGLLMKDGSRRREHPELKVGDHVLYMKYGANEREIDDVKYVSVREDSIHGVLEADA